MINFIMFSYSMGGFLSNEISSWDEILLVEITCKQKLFHPEMIFCLGYM